MKEKAKRYLPIHLIVGSALLLGGVGAVKEADHLSTRDQRAAEAAFPNIPSSYKDFDRATSEIRIFDKTIHDDLVKGQQPTISNSDLARAREDSNIIKKYEMERDDFWVTPLAGTIACLMIFGVMELYKGIKEIVKKLRHKPTKPGNPWLGVEAKLLLDRSTKKF